MTYLHKFASSQHLRAMNYSAKPRRTFSDALLWHMQEERVKIADLASGAGVSVDVIKKLRTRSSTSTSAENAQRISAYFGKSVANFLELAPKDANTEFNQLFDLLSDAEKGIVIAQMRGILGAR